MKKRFLTMFLVGLIGGNSFAQSTTATNNQLFSQVRRIGFDNNFCLRTVTNGITRSRLNHTVSYGVGGYGITPKDGYMLMGYSQTYSAAIFNPFNTNQGAYSLLHLNGPNGTFVQNGGYRPWMQTGVTFTDNNDLSYMGIRSVALDVTETTIAWSDNSGGISGPDQMVFRFTSGNAQISGAVANSVSTNLLAVNDLDGLHVARFTATSYSTTSNNF